MRGKLSGSAYRGLKSPGASAEERRPERGVSGVSGFRAEGFGVSGFRALGFQGLGLRALGF